MDTDEQIFRDIIHLQLDLTWRVCSSYRMGAAWTNEDAFHEVLCNLWRGFKSFDRRSSESTWVYRVANNTAKGSNAEVDYLLSTALFFFALL